MQAWPFNPLRPLAGYEVIVANPPLPWETYGNTDRARRKTYQRTHGALAVEQIKAMPVGQLARDQCLLLLCTPKTRLDVGLDIMRAWGFTYKSEIVCRLLTKRGKPFRGTGLRVLHMHLSFLLGVIGSPKHRLFPSMFDGVARAGGEIPHALFDLAEACCPGRWQLELFAPEARQGWDTWSLARGQVEPVLSLASSAPKAVAA